MADRQIKNLNEENTVANADLFVLQKASTDETKKVQAANILPDDSVTASKISGIDKSNLATDSNPYKFYAYRSGAYDQPNNGVVPLNATLFDTNSDFDTVNYDYIVPIDGFYQFNFCVRSETIAGIGYFSQLTNNGVEICRSSGYISGYTNTTGWNGLSGSILVECSAGDLIDLRYVGNATTSNNTLQVNSYATYLNGFLVSRT